MKRLTAIVLIALLLLGVACAENLRQVSDVVTGYGYKATSAKNRSGLSGCWLEEGKTTDTLRWSDKKNIYTVTAAKKKGLRDVYAEILELSGWDTCSYTEGDKVLFAFNAPEVEAEREYKTLKNYIRYVTQYIQEQAQPVVGAASGRGNSYVINKSSKKFHLPNCQYVEQIKAENKETFKGKRETLIQRGYEPCKKCNP